MHSTLLALVVVMLGITATLSAPLEQRQGNQRRGPETREELIHYLRQVGHWRGPESDTKGTDEDLKESLMAFQSYSGLNATGDFDDDTKKLMATPKCGVLDDSEASGRQKRYSYHSGMKWPMTALTYRIVNYTPDLPTNVTKSEIIKAFKFWSDVSPLTFTESDASDANIKISFVYGDHGDGNPFEETAQGYTIAHAYGYPPGYIHFNDDMKWTLDPSSDTNLLWTTTHEIGHAIGLAHSLLPSSIMNTYSTGRNANYTLDADDIEAIQNLYDCWAKNKDTLIYGGTKNPANSLNDCQTACIALGRHACVGIDWANSNPPQSQCFLQKTTMGKSPGPGVGHYDYVC